MAFASSPDRETGYEDSAPYHERDYRKFPDPQIALKKAHGGERSPPKWYHEKRVSTPGHTRYPRNEGIT